MNQRHIDHNIRALDTFYWLDTLSGKPPTTFFQETLPIIAWLDTYAEDGSDY